MLTPAQVNAHAHPAANAAPTAAFTAAPATTTVGTAVTFNSAGSVDPDGTISSYSWNYGDGSATGTGATSTHTYTGPGTFTATLTVTDNGGATGTVSHPVTVTAANVAPTASFTSSTNNLVATFDGSGSTDSDGTITSYAWTYGDGATDTGVTPPSHTYAKAGTYSVKLTVTDNGGLTNSVTKQVVVSAANVAPTASFTSTPTNLAVAFDGSASSDSDGTIASYAWTYGDGATGTGASPNHTYAAAGTYTVTLTVTDNVGATGTVSHDVTVAPAANNPPNAVFTSTTTGLTANFNGSGSTDSDGTIASYAWDFGDGPPAGTSTQASPSYTYTSAGTYTVTLTVTDDDGATNVQTHTSP